MHNSETKQTRSIIKKRHHRRRGVVLCKHGCGLEYLSKGFSKRRRDAFDYHEKATCPKLPSIMCIPCSRKGIPKVIQGPYRYNLHCKGTVHVNKVNENTPAFKDLFSMMEEVVDEFSTRMSRVSPMPVPSEEIYSSSPSRVSSPTSEFECQPTSDETHSLEPDFEQFLQRARSSFPIDERSSVSSPDEMEDMMFLDPEFSISALEADLCL
eukprot:TRINITY_DN93_c0_g1_i1.p1 TRINITY_DN93_c0_g1~~TRINITY_DN93_c0_g1_i1.p1  ORF type:complete len:210 (-),score=10.25 TRINITY_DN93_c0_g1_i1:93-722(-)